MKSLIIGSTAGLGRSLSEQLAKQGDALFLVASDAEDLAAQTQDLRLRFSVTVNYAAVSLADLNVEKVKQQVSGTLGLPDAIFFVAGQCPDGDDGRLSGSEVASLVAINLTSCLQLVSAFLPCIEASGSGRVILVGSIASARGRGNRLVYGATKAGLAFFAEALRHRLSQSPANVHLYQMGYLQTNMSWGSAMKLPGASPDAAAAFILRTSRCRGRDWVFPRWWRPILLVLKCLPWFLYKRVRV